MSDELISINEAAARGVARVRKPVWADPCDHLMIDIIDGRAGLWTRLYAPFNKECNGCDPMVLGRWERGMDYDARIWVPHTGPTADSDEYKAAAEAFSGCLSR